MKIKIILLIKVVSKFTLYGTALLLISFSTLLASKSNGQNVSVKDVYVEIDSNYGSVDDLFKVIESQTNYRFAYSKDNLSSLSDVNISGGQRSVYDILIDVSKEKKLKFTQINYSIAVEKIRNRERKTTGTVEIQQGITITGTVSDKESGDKLPGVNVIIKGKNQGTVTDINGKFTLNVPDSKTVLIFSSVGYVTQEIPVGTKTVLDVSLAPDVTSLEEVVVVGYSTQKKVNITGAVESISTEQIANRPIPKMDEVLRGMAPNLNISLSNRGGEPGASSTWNIRGLGTLSGSNAPLILVDGVQMDINNIDPSNVESVSVLKDASASAIYGSRAPFGVVLITTKKGKKDGSVSIQYNNNFAFGTPIGIGHLESSLVYATALNEAAANTGLPPVYNDEYLARIKGYLDGTFPYEYDPDNPPHNIWAGRRVGNANYDWPHEWVKNFKMDQTHSINVSGGTAKTQYYTSFGYFDQDGFLNYGYDDYRRINFLGNLTSTITKWLKFNVSTKYANTYTDYPHGITTVDRQYMWLSLYQWSPLTPKYNINGSIGNPWIRSQQSSGRIKTKINDLLLTGGAEIEPVKGWKTNVTYTYNIVADYMESNPKPVWVELGTGGYGNVGKPNATYSSMFSYSPYSLFNAVTSYEKSFTNNYFKILIGYEQENQFYSRLDGHGGILITEEVPSISTSLGTKTVDDTKWDWATQGIFGRLNYNYKEKYLVEFSARYNGSSRFAPDSRWGFFPSGSVGYQISRENFWSSIEPYVNTFKLRASYGSLGNQNVANYLYIPSIPVYSETPWIIGNSRPAYATTPGLISDDLTWETITTTNIGLDAGFLRNRLQMSFDWFKRTTSEMFGPAETLPYTLGTTAPKANNAEIETRGFELVLKWKDRVSSDFSYDAQIGLGDAHSTILKYINENGFINTWYEGKAVGEIWGFITDGIFQTQEEADAIDQSAIYPSWGPGDMGYKDLNGDGKITTGNQTLNDHGDLTVIGNTTPRYNITITGGLNWKNFDFSMQWFGVMKRDYLPAPYNPTFNGLNNSWLASNFIKESKTLDYWRPENEENMFGPNVDAYFAKPYLSMETYKNRKNQSRYVLNAGFLRLRFLQLGYTVPQHLSEKVFLKNARIFISGENLLTIKSLPKSIDPESSLHPVKQSWGGYADWGGFYPMARSFSIGVNLTF